MLYSVLFRFGHIRRWDQCAVYILLSMYANPSPTAQRVRELNVAMLYSTDVILKRKQVKVGVNVKAVFTSLNTAFLPISRSRFKRRQIPMLITLSTIWQFCVNFWVIFRCFGKERFFLKG